MKTGSILACLFLLFLLGEASFIHAFPGILSHIPLMTIAGMIVMQRVGMEEGAAWFLALALFHSDISALCIAIIGPILITRLFTTRSVYALIGFGISAYSAVLLIALIFPPHSVTAALQSELLLLPGLLIGISMVRFCERSLFTRIALRPSS